MASLLIPNLLPLILPATLNYLPIPARYRNNRRLLIGGLSLYIIYTFASAELPTWSRPTFYQLLNLPRNVAEYDGAIRDGWKLWARKNHPDRGGSPDMFVVARKAYDIIGDDVKRWAYDRFGPEVAEWKGVVTERDYLLTGIIRSVGFYIVSFGVMVFLWITGQSKGRTSFWRHISLPVLCALELALLMLPTLSPTSPDFRAIIPLPLRLLIRVFPQRTQHQHILFLHNVFMAFTMALQQVGPLIWPVKRLDIHELPAEVRERELSTVVERLAVLIRVAELEAARLYTDEIAPIRRDDAAHNRKAPESLETLLEADMVQHLIDMRISNHPAVAPVWMRAVMAGRAQNEAEAAKAGTEGAKAGAEKELEQEQEMEGGDVNKAKASSLVSRASKAGGKPP